MKKWICSQCGHIHVGNAPPAVCPVCGAPREKFKLHEEESAYDAKAAEITAADILVVGSGAAAFAAAVTAKNKGASVIMLEKANSVGGTTARSGGGYWIPNNSLQKAAGYADNREDALRYMARYSYPHLYDAESETLGLPKREYSLLEAMFDYGAPMVDYFDELGALKSKIEINWTGKAQVDYQNALPENKGIRGRSIYVENEEGGLGPGSALIDQMQAWAKANGIAIYTDCEVVDIVQDYSGKVTGLDVLEHGTKRRFEAGRGVIFGSGGYSHNSEYMLQFQRGPHFGGCSVPTNTGDFIRMAGKIGARLGNTAGAFRAESMVEVALAHPGGSSNVFYLPGDSMLMVNKYGLRVVNEKRNYTDRTMAHFVWDANKAEWENMFTFMLFDQRAANLWQGFPPYPVQSEPLPPQIIKADTWAGIAAEIEKRLATMSKHTGGAKLDESFVGNLQETIERFNEYAKTGVDKEFARGETDYDKEWTTFPPTVPGIEEWPPKDSKNYTMYPLSQQGPYYAVIFCAGTLDTNGGPVIDAYARILDYDDKPIDGLYGAGNCIASPTANAYWGGGSTIGPGMTFGYIAALHAMGAL